jgi:hypothetical protein
MDVVIASNLFTPSECKTINYCRMFLRVHSIADLTLAGGNHIDFSFLALDPSLLSSTSTLIESLQDRPQTASALKLWQRANRLWCNTVTGGLHRPLGKWLVPGHSFGGFGHFILIQIPKRCGVRQEKDSMFILALYLAATGGLHNCRRRHTLQSSVMTIDPPPMPNTPTFLANLPLWQQSLLDQLTTEHSFSTDLPVST